MVKATEKSISTNMELLFVSYPVLKPMFTGERETEEMGVGRNFHAIGVIGFVPIAIFLPTGIKEGFCREPFHVDKWSDVGIRVPERQGVRYFQC